jgi:hypothetical protein
MVDHLPVGNLPDYTLQVNNFLGFPPHTWIVVTGPDGVRHGYGFTPTDQNIHLGPVRFVGPGEIEDDTATIPTVPGDPVILTPAQYNNLSQFINNAIDNPPFYNSLGGQECTNWVYDAINATYNLSVGDPGWTCPVNLQITLQNFYETLAHNPYTNALGQLTLEQLEESWWNLGEFSNRLLDWLTNGPIPFPNGNVLSQGAINFVVNQYQQALISGDFFTDPIVLDLSGANSGSSTGVQLTSINNSNAFFDLNGTGFAVHTGWVGPTTGILVDTAHPTSIADLFGSSSVTGFTALEALDVNGTHVLNASDPGWANLSVWEDTNGNGVADSGEVQSLSSLGITSINLNAVPVNENINGNIVGDVATFTYANGSTGQVAEAFFNNDPLNSEFNGSYTLNPETLTLPNLRGLGTTADLNIAMSLDSTLLGMVQNLANETIAAAANFTAQVKAIIYEWAGVANVDPTSRGAFVNARDLGVLEQLTGAPFLSEGSGNPHNALQGQFIANAFGDFLSTVEEQLLVQGPLASLFPNLGFNYDSNSLQGTADLSSVITAASPAAPTDMVSAARYWANIASFVGDVANDLGISQSTYESALQSAIAASGLAAGFVQSLQNSQSNLTLTAGSGKGMLIAGSGSFDILDARNSAGNDVAITGDGNSDRLYGGTIGNAGNDLLIAGDGANDQLYAGSGNATLIAGNGSNDLLSTVGFGGGSSTISMTAGDGSGDTLNADNTTGPVTLSVGNGANDTLVAGSGANSLTAGNGNNDILEVHSSSAADTLITGTGNDTFIVSHGLAPGSSIHGGGGNDFLNAQGDISSTTLSGVQTLGVAGQLTVTAAQFGQFAAIQSVFNSFGNDVYGATAGTYDLMGRSSDSINLHAESNGGTTLIGNNADGGHLYASASGNDTLQIGDGNNDQLYAGGGNDTLIAGAGVDYLQGGSGNDTFVVGAGNDTLIGGTGANTAVFSGKIADYDILYSTATRSFTVTDQAAGPSGGIDTITGIDVFKFANGTVIYNAQGDLVSQTYTAPSGATWVDAYDPQSTASWVWSASDYDPNGNLLSQTGLNQDGTHWLSLYDAGNQYSWSNATITFDSDWNWLSVTGTNDDGSHTVTAGSIAGAYDTLLWFTTPYDPNGSSITPLTLRKRRARRP